MQKETIPVLVNVMIINEDYNRIRTILEDKVKIQTEDKQPHVTILRVTPPESMTADCSTEELMQYVLEHICEGCLYRQFTVPCLGCNWISASVHPFGHPEKTVYIE